MKTVLITGVAGFAGSHLARHLVAHDSCRIVGTCRPDADLSRLAGIADRLVLRENDLNDADAVSELVTGERPDEVYHLAAQSSPALSFERPRETLTGNIVGELNVLEAVRTARPQARVLIVTSGDVYGMATPAGVPLDERVPFRPASPYAVSKIAQDYLAWQYHLVHDVDVVRVRPFNHAGPAQKPGFVITDFARQIAEIEAGRKEPVMAVGDVHVRRDFTDVRDVVNAYHLALGKGASGDVYNIGSGVSRRLSDVLDTLLSYSKAAITVRPDPRRFRVADVPDVVCDYGRLNKATGWQPVIPFEQTLRQVLDHWRRVTGSA